MSNNITYKIKSIPDGFEIYDPSDNQLNLGDIALLSELKVKYVTSPKAENFYIKITDTDDTDNYTISVTTVKDDFITGGSRDYYSDTYLKYTINGEDWFLLISNGEITPITGLSKNSKVYFKGILKQKSTDPFTTFTVTKNNNEKAKFKVGGNILTLTNDKDTSSQTIPPHAFGCLFSSSNIVSASDLRIPLTTSEYCYYKMFNWCISLTTVPSKLPATTLANNCYYYMFYWSSSLTTAPELPATALTESCYQDMFRGCISLTTAPELPATTLAENCYNGMFSECTSLTTAPSVLPATTLANNCYSDMFFNCTSLTSAPSSIGNIFTSMETSACTYMFCGCKSLTTAPELPATALASYCYYKMFMYCTSLTSAPKLPAFNLANNCYSNMFEGCTGLTTAPVLPAITLVDYCYQYMFSGCKSLETAPNLSNIGYLSSGSCQYMFADCSNLRNVGAIGKKDTTLWWGSYCYSNMFKGCTSLKIAPELPATKLEIGCYQEMFRGCTSLTTAPSVLPATNLNGADYCYSYMFYGCTSLKIAPELPATKLAKSCYQYMFYGCSGLTSAPELPATKLETYCYYRMFQGCSSLTAITCLAIVEVSLELREYTTDWVYGLPTGIGSGKFTKAERMTSWPRAPYGIPPGWNVENKTE